MKRLIAIGLVLLLLDACISKHDPFIGRWTVDKVNVDFDADGTTPEMVKQMGAMEKDNVLIISPDSVLTLIMDADTMRCCCSLRGSQILCDGQPWGQFENGTIKTETLTPVGYVRTLYKKTNY